MTTTKTKPTSDKPVPGSDPWPRFRAAVRLQAEAGPGREVRWPIRGDEPIVESCDHRGRVTGTTQRGDLVRLEQEADRVGLLPSDAHALVTRLATRLSGAKWLADKGPESDFNREDHRRLVAALRASADPSLQARIDVLDGKPSLTADEAAELAALRQRQLDPEVGMNWTP